MNNYNDYVFDNEKFIGNFEEMYQNCDDPWHQKNETYNKTRHIIVLNLIKNAKPKKILEIGCGFGLLTKIIDEQNQDSIVLGIDISLTAIKKAQEINPHINFQNRDILDFNFYKEYQPDLIILSWTLWYVLDKIDDFINFFRVYMPNTKIINCFTVYSREQQKYGKEKFNSLEEVMQYFDANFYEWGSCFDNDGNQNSYFICDYKKAY